VAAVKLLQDRWRVVVVTATEAEAARLRGGIATYLSDAAARKAATAMGAVERVVDAVKRGAAGATGAGGVAVAVAPSAAAPAGTAAHPQHEHEHEADTFKPEEQFEVVALAPTAADNPFASDEGVALSAGATSGASTARGGGVDVRYAALVATVHMLSTLQVGMRRGGGVSGLLAERGGGGWGAVGFIRTTRPTR
jgi:hypothetical protein